MAGHRALCGRPRPLGHLAETLSRPPPRTVFKAFSDRPKDWVDIGEMASYGAPSLNLEEAAHWVREIVGDDPRVQRLLGLKGSQCSRESSTMAG